MLQEKLANWKHYWFLNLLENEAKPKEKVLWVLGSQLSFTHMFADSWKNVHFSSPFFCIKKHWKSLWIQVSCSLQLNSFPFHILNSFVFNAVNTSLLIIIAISKIFLFHLAVHYIKWLSFIQTYCLIGFVIIFIGDSCLKTTVFVGNLCDQNLSFVPSESICICFCLVPRRRTTHDHFIGYFKLDFLMGFSGHMDHMNLNHKTSWTPTCSWKFWNPKLK